MQNWRATRFFSIPGQSGNPMLLHHLRMSLRTLSRQRATTAINVVGLGLGIACFLLIGLFVRDELSYDRHHEHADSIVRMGLHIFLDGTESNYATVAAPVAEGLRERLPEVVDAVRMRDASTQIWYEDRVYDEDNFFWADPSLFNVFTLPLIAGDPDTALDEPGSVIVGESTARKYFGGVSEAIGKIVLRNNDEPWTVTGVFEDVPDASHFHPDFIATFVGLDYWVNSESWATQNNFATYVRLTSGGAISDFEAGLPALIKEKVWPEAEQLFGVPAEQIFASGTQFDYIVEPLTDIHLRSNLSAQFEPGGSITYVWIFGAIAIAILLIACINYVNLSTAVSGRKAREVGVRKAVGSSREQLVHQFLSDSLVTTVLGVILGIGLTWLALPLLNMFTGKALSMAVLAAPPVLLAIAGLVVVVTLLAGAYPAFVLSSYRPALVLKGARVGRGRSGFRNGLIVFQYGVSSALVLAALVVYGQLDYVQNKNLGFSGDQVVVIHNADDVFENLPAFKEQLRSMAAVKAVSSSSHTFGRPSNDNLYTPVGSPDSEGRLIWTNMADDAFDDVYDLELVEGRFIDRNFPGDETAIVLNETAVRLLDLDEPVGTRLNTRIGDGTYTVVGVVKDFHVESFDRAIKPFLFASNLAEDGWENGTVSVKLATDNVEETLQAMEDAWLAISGGQAFRYDFFDDLFEERYMREQQVGRILIVFSMLAILIACLGLFGLAAFVTTQRTKEIGIRKSLGASASGIVVMLFRDFGRWIVVANLIAWPVAWWMMSDWLQQFVYRTDVALWYFPASLLVGVLLAFLTIGGKTWRAAMANPVDALRYE
ncbi:MAG: FtsX-like permease family protein [Rhodothermales bacterium]|nr:FtsX-like permease family protein [Rhodothermales bacterium]